MEGFLDNSFGYAVFPSIGKGGIGIGGAADKGKSADAFLMNAPFFRFNLNYTSKHDSIFYQDFYEALQNEELISLAKKFESSVK